MPAILSVEIATSASRIPTEDTVNGVLNGSTEMLCLRRTVRPASVTSVDPNTATTRVEGVNARPTSKETPVTDANQIIGDSRNAKDAKLVTVELPPSILNVTWRMDSVLAARELLE